MQKSVKTKLEFKTIKEFFEIYFGYGFGSHTRTHISNPAFLSIPKI